MSLTFLKKYTHFPEDPHQSAETHILEGDQLNGMRTVDWEVTSQQGGNRHLRRHVFPPSFVEFSADILECFSFQYKIP